MSQKLDLVKIKKALKDFSVERDWEKFHNPKNLSMASLSVEVSELVEIFQWVNDYGDNIAMPLCKLGCDDLFEKKYLIDDSKGMI